MIRQSAAGGWLLFMFWVTWTWLGLTGIGLTCVVATRWLRSLWQAEIQEFAFDPAALQRIWIVPLAVCIDTGNGPLWLCRDEVPPARWAELLRCLYRHVPPQVKS